MPVKQDRWAALAAPPAEPEQTLRRLERALAREEALREQIERLVADQAGDLILANERLDRQHEEFLVVEQRERARLAHELATAQHIQSSLLPRDLSVAGLDIAAVMRPCTEMGGDYYDIRLSDDGCWLGIGDVAGHGVPAGLVMLMLQCAVAALTAADRDATPSQILVGVNGLLYDNIRARMNSDEHITATLLRYRRDGRLVFAGAHEDIVVLRARTGACELFETHGSWLGVVPDIGRATRDEQLRLEPGDTLLLYTDGLTESASATGEQFGLARVCAALERCPAGPARVTLDALMADLYGFSEVFADDVTALVLRYTGACV